MRSRKCLISASLLVALAIAACGGGGDPGETTKAEKTEETRTLTKAELISQGDAICAEVNAAVGAVGASAASSDTQVGQIADLYGNMVASLLRLGTPAESEGYSEFIQAAEELAKVEGEAKLAAEREEPEALADASGRATVALEAFESQAAIYGFEQCSQGPGVPAAAPEGGGEAGGVEASPEIEEVVPEEVVPEEVTPETGGAGGGVEEAAPEEAAPEEGGGSSESGGVGPG
ncbi:MAG: hypothetical protein R2725_10495 [Solirubrobacterales bacterium]